MAIFTNGLGPGQFSYTFFLPFAVVLLSDGLTNSFVGTPLCLQTALSRV